MSDKINVTTCPKCGKETKQQLPIMYTNAEKQFAVWWEPVPDEQVDFECAMYKQMSGNSNYLATAARVRAWNTFKKMILSYERDYKDQESIQSHNDRKNVVTQTIWRRFLNFFQRPTRNSTELPSSAITKKSKSFTTAFIIIPGNSFQTDELFKVIGAKLKNKNLGELDPLVFPYSVSAQPFGKIGSAKIYCDPESAFEILFQLCREVEADPLTKVSIAYNDKEEQREFKIWMQNNA